MKRIAMFAMSLGVALFAAGCGNSHGDRDAKHDLQQANHAVATDVNQAAHDVEHAVDDLNHAKETTIVNVQSDVRQATAIQHDVVRRQPELITVHEEVRPAPLPTPGQLNQEVKTDAVNAAGAAAEAEAEKLLKVR
jgi:hypothetical protein